MDREAGPQVVMQESFGYGSHTFYQHRLAARNGYGSMRGSKQAGLPVRLNPSEEDSCADDYSENEQWKGFSSFRLQRGPDAGRSSPLCDAERGRPHLIGASDLRLDVAGSSIATEMCIKEQKRKQSLVTICNGATQISAQRRESILDEDPESSSRKFICTGADDASNELRNPKRCRSSSPGNQTPVCQVDDCHTDLKHAKDYHRRHKVCESHSKAPQSLVQNAIQRFCQQCSRFHPLEEFDEGKRSCRRRLAGHNKRRRKTDVAATSTPLSEVVKGTDRLIDLVAFLSQLQAAEGKGEIDSHGVKHESLPVSSAPQSHQSNVEPPQSNQNLKKANSSPPEGLPKETLCNTLQNQAMAARGRTPLQITLSQFNPQNAQGLPTRTGESSEDHSRNVIGNSLPLDLACNLKLTTALEAGELCSRPDVSKQHLGHTDLSSFEEEDSDWPPKNAVRRPLEEQNFFPIECGRGFKRAEGDRLGEKFCNSGLNFQEEDLNSSPCSLRTDFEASADKSKLPPSDSSEYASDRSPSRSSSNEEGTRKNGRIIFKLCDPQHVETMTQNHESEIEQWLSLKPHCLEGYLRPGCVLLTVFLSMPLEMWEQLATNLAGSLEKLVCLSQSDLWTIGRIIVQMGPQRALILNGRVRTIRFSRTSECPQLWSVRPLAIVAGQQATLSVYGDKLVPGTRIVCVYCGRYILQEVRQSGSKVMGFYPYSNASRSCIDVQEFHFPGGPTNVLGRCFIEVEHGFMGNAIPVIVANKEICMELRSLELDLDSEICEELEQSRCFSFDQFRIGKAAEAMNFLHELGWIFQSTPEQVNQNVDSDGGMPQIDLFRFKGVLKYAILRDWCAVVKQLLDLLFLLGAQDDAEIVHVLSEINLLHQAVKRKCKPMVALLLHYMPVRHGLRKQNLFTPVVEGPEGSTPLHVAANMSDALEIVDALTEDPGEAGLHGWKTAFDPSGRTPEWHARHGEHFSYIELVEKKLLRKFSPSFKITVVDKTESCTELKPHTGNINIPSTESVGTTALQILDLPRKFTLNSTPVCRDCRRAARPAPFRLARSYSRMYRPLMMMTVGIAAVCATVALLYKTGPMLDCIVYSLKLEEMMYGSQ